ncbi:hypothetical protein ASPVEDRAFT_65802 [Aspergillus versicolor CBS 583.65]|uniref:Transcriptional repressor Tup1 N-terminal domain-containing protein n=1 Tax=Aspergillus versicolor CBS 583.65 TaxID=1036611 RepID=A0A1L9Q0W3_ASPVE|nr:uncharacterized protein ASPVEDRAFT_65802 [Aspergillus versicolor CBS 583.65]OJJ07417.1 hypothetical protein ASPVEDRAFT_65802 [Aspergillus versicolor CBS 583.65]
MDNTNHTMAPSSSSRSSVLLDQIHQEFQNQSRASAEYEYKLADQLHEMYLIQQQISELLAAQLKMRESYEAEIQDLRYQLQSRGVTTVSSDLAPPGVHRPALFRRRPGDKAPNILADLSRANLSSSQKKEGRGWYAVFNPEVPRVLDIELVHHLAHDSVACCVSFSPDGKYLATGCNRMVRMFDVTTGENVITLQDDRLSQRHDIYIRSVCFSPDGKYLATGSEDKIVTVWDVSARVITHTFPGHEQDIYSLTFAGNGRYLASGSGDKTVRLWDILSGELVHIFNIEGGVTAVAVSPDGRYVAAASLDMNAQVWDTATGTMVERLAGPNGHDNSVYCVAFSPNGRNIVSGSLDNTLKIWELGPPRGAHPGTGDACIRTLKGHKDFVLTTCWTPGGSWIISGSKDHGFQFWDPSTGTAHMLVQGHRNSVLSVAVSNTDTLIATGSGDKCARIWRYSSYTGQ